MDKRSAPKKSFARLLRIFKLTLAPECIVVLKFENMNRSSVGELVEKPREAVPEPVASFFWSRNLESIFSESDVVAFRSAKPCRQPVLKSRFLENRLDVMCPISSSDVLVTQERPNRLVWQPLRQVPDYFVETAEERFLQMVERAFYGLALSDRPSKASFIKLTDKLFC